MLKDELEQNARHKEIGEELAKLRGEKKAIEEETRAGSPDYAELETIKVDLKSDQELLADIALAMYAKGETVELVDDEENHWVPEWKVIFKKG